MDNASRTRQYLPFPGRATALSSTVGLGNIAGVAVAISLGGPGATFWIIVAGLLGMSSKFAECTLGVKYRRIDENGVVSGGPMYYLKDGLKKRGLPRIGSFYPTYNAPIIALLPLLASQHFPIHQIHTQLSTVIPVFAPHGLWSGVA
jgi:AGCS family alanine or glycine:cation symporter